MGLFVCMCVCMCVCVREPVWHCFIRCLGKGDTVPEVCVCVPRLIAGRQGLVCCGSVVSPLSFYLTRPTPPPLQFSPFWQPPPTLENTNTHSYRCPYVHTHTHTHTQTHLQTCKTAEFIKLQIKQVKVLIFSSCWLSGGCYVKAWSVSVKHPFEGKLWVLVCLSVLVYSQTVYLRGISSYSQLILIFTHREFCGNF